MSEPQTGRPITPAERELLDLEIEEHCKKTTALNEEGDREARAAGKRGAGVEVSRGFVVHPDDRGALKRQRRKR